MTFITARRLALAGACSLAAVALTGCGSSVPGCSDSATTDLVVEIADRELVKQIGVELAKTITWEVTAIRTTDENEKTGALSCAADLQFTGPAKTETAPITYTVEATDDGDFYVNVFGL